VNIYYRGTVPGETKRISTGCTEWDDNLFCSTSEKSASYYGKHIEVILAKPEAKILVEGTREFNRLIKKPRKMQSMLEWYVNAIKQAKQAGYDIVEFKHQTDVGTVILNEDMVVRNYRNYEYGSLPQGKT